MKGVAIDMAMDRLTALSSLVNLFVGARNKDDMERQTVSISCVKQQVTEWSWDLRDSSSPTCSKISPV